jgi:hypothetical protein
MMPIIGNILWRNIKQLVKSKFKKNGVGIEKLFPS